MVFLHPSFISNQSGSTLPVFGVGLLAIFALVGAAMSIGMDSGTANKLQNSADSAALAGATAFITSEKLNADENLALAKSTARTYAERNLDAVVKRADVDALTNDAFGQTTRVTVELEFHPSNLFNRVGTKESRRAVTRGAQAVATRGFPLCVLALAKDGPGIAIEDASFLDATPCALWSNSSALDSVLLDGMVTVSAQSLCAVGRVKGTASGPDVPASSNNCQPIPDPLRDWTPPAVGDCNKLGGTVQAGKPGIPLKLSPGTYCGGLAVRADEVVFEPGLFIFRDGPLQISATKATVAEDVTLMMSGTDAKLEVVGQGSLRLVAPASGPLAGLAIIEDRTTAAAVSVAPSENGQSAAKSTQTAPVPELSTVVSGNGSLYIEGAIYLPNQTVLVSGKGLAEKSSPYLQIIAKRVHVSSRGELAIDFRESEISVPVVIEPERIARLVN